VGFGDNLDPTNNPAILRAEGADELWAKKGPAGTACVDCHAGGPLASMKGVATRYPQYVAKYRRVMSIEDLLTVHAPETTGLVLAEESADNLDLTMRIKMASNGMPVRLPLERPENQAALARGKASFSRRVGQRGHACADCHTAGNGRGAGRFLGGRLLADAQDGLTRHFPTWRTSQADVWDMRKRMQWCMTPLGANMLTADAVEYAELELYLTSFDQAKPMSVPGIRH
jgi:sulfur-oxidizing protein SoxA